jgi:hypothetical protein
MHEWVRLGTYFYANDLGRVREIWNTILEPAGLYPVNARTIVFILSALANTGYRYGNAMERAWERTKKFFETMRLRTHSGASSNSIASAAAGPTLTPNSTSGSASDSSSSSSSSSSATDTATSPTTITTAPKLPSKNIVDIYNQMIILASRFGKHADVMHYYV